MTYTIHKYPFFVSFSIHKGFKCSDLDIKYQSLHRNTMFESVYARILQGLRYPFKHFGVIIIDLFSKYFCAVRKNILIDFFENTVTRPTATLHNVFIRDPHCVHGGCGIVSQIMETAFKT